MTDVPRIESVFGRAEIAEMRARFAQEKAVRAAQVMTEAGRALLDASRTVIDKDRNVLTIVDGDVLDHIKAMEPAGLDGVWREAEAALDAWPGRQPGDGLHVHADVFDDALGYCADARGIRNGRVDMLAERKALTPTAALRALTAHLTREASDSPEKP